MAQEPGLSAPDIMAITDDHADDAVRAGGSRYRSKVDIISVYLEGGPAYQLNNKVYHFSPPIAILLPQGGIDNDLQRGKLQGTFVLFKGNGLVRMKRDLGNEAIVSLGEERQAVPLLKELTVPEAGKIVSLMHEMKSLPGTGVSNHLKRAGLLYEIISEYCLAPGRVGGMSAHREATRLHELIQAWGFENTQLSKVYEELDLSSAHAETLFRKAFGMSAIAYRTQLRLRRARELLVSSQYNVSQVAYAVGFTDPLYFSKVFTKAYGVPPSQLIRDFASSRKQTIGRRG